MCVCVLRLCWVSVRTKQLVAMVKRWRRAELNTPTNMAGTTGNSTHKHVHYVCCPIVPEPENRCSECSLPPNTKLRCASAQVRPPGGRRRTPVLHDVSLADSSGCVRPQKRKAPVGGHLACGAAGALPRQQQEVGGANEGTNNLKACAASSLK